MLPVSQASLVSKMRADGPTIPEGLREYARLEYNGDAAAIFAAYRHAARSRRLRTNGGAVRTVLRALAKVPQTLVAALATPGGE
jgi:hypothetical protein